MRFLWESLIYCFLSTLLIKNKNIIQTKIHNTKLYFIVVVKVYIINLLILITKYYKL